MCEVSKSSVELHTLDISKPILEPSSLASLAESCKTWGFFRITNHGVSSDMYGRIQSMSKDVFTLPLHTKLRLGPSSPAKTYTPQFIASPFFESLKVSGPDFSASAQTSADILFDHQHHSLFSDTLHEYGNKMAELSKRITQILLMCLGEGFDRKYESEFKDCHGYLRINNYSPPHDHHDHDDDNQTMMEGLGMHTDMSCVTIVYQDLSGGLQVRSNSSEGNNEWVEIRPREGTLVVNVGDMFQAWSNDRLRSSEHRVVLRPSRDHHRFSLAFFWGFPDQKLVISPEEVVKEDGERAYEPFVCLDYLRFRENDERGRFDKVGFTVKHFAGLASTPLH